MKKIMLSLLLGIGFLSASAQNEGKTVNVFCPHWYVQAQGGAQYSLGEVSFGHLITPNAQVAVGYQFNKVAGVRLNVNAWESKGGSRVKGYNHTWKYNYVAPALDATFNLSNLFCGFNPNRILNVGVFAGIGANIGFNNDDAAIAEANIRAHYAQPASETPYLDYLWDGTHTRLIGQAGITVDFRISKAVSVGLEVNANTINDHYNSKKAGNADWYFNALAGVKVNLGKTHTVKTVPCCQAEPKIVEKVVEKVIEKVVEKPVEKTVEIKKADPLRRDVFFTIKSTEVTTAEMIKVQEIATYLKENPNAKVTITGHADKGTGNSKINHTLSVKRADIVAKVLQEKFGISSDRIIKEAKGDTVQPYDIEVLNRVSICIAK